MVRLKGSACHLALICRRYFNSTMVRLKDNGKTYSLTKKIFQFHYGSVKSWLRKSTSALLKYFNSTMVRLKVKAEMPEIAQKYNFNSTMVRLKACCCRRRPKMLEYFNSTMVRLKEGKRGEKKLLLRKFQFHYGSVKSRW